MRAKILIFFYKYYKCFAKNLGMFYEKHLDIFFIFCTKVENLCTKFLEISSTFS